MIEYTPNRDWFGDLKHLGTSWTLRRIVRAVLFVGLYAGAVSALVIWTDFEGQRAISGTFSLLGVILSIILVFRTNSAYDRWWEGRKQWGTLVNHARNLAIQLDALLPTDDLETRSAFARLLGDFALALSGHLRGAVEPSTWKCLDSASPDETPAHVPARIAREVVGRVQRLARSGAIDGTDLLNTKPHTQALMDVAGACERIRKTPIPFSYSVFIKLFILAYAAILPIGLAPEYGFFAVPLVMLIVFALLGLELMAEEIEDPFGLDCNDLPTGTLAATIRADTADLLRVAHTPKPDPAATYTKFF